MSQKRFWTGLILGSVALAGLSGYLIRAQYGSIEQGRADIERLRQEIDASRTLLTGTPKLEREVIVLRETEETVKEILPDETDVNNLVRDLRRFEEDSGVQISSYKKKTEPGRRDKEKTDFTKVTYQLSIEADAFQLLAFLDRVENHTRFMSVTNFKISAASRRQVDTTGATLHKVQMDVETYVYEPRGGQKSVKIDGYDRKREILLGEISRRRSSLQVVGYTYHGPRARRDPWVDPRIPAGMDPMPGPPVAEQLAIVDELSGRMKDVQRIWDAVRDTKIIIEEMTLQAELEQKLALLESDLKDVLTEGSVRFPSAERRLHYEVVDPSTTVRREILERRGNRGPTLEELREVLATMNRGLEQGDYQLAISAYATVESGLDLAMDPQRRPLVESLRHKADEARILADFTKQKIDIRGVAIMENVPPVALINGKAVGVGDAVGRELVIQGIRPGEIEFVFRGVVLVRRY